VADYFGMVFYEVSSKENINVDSMFYVIGSMFVELNRNKTLTLQRPLVSKLIRNIPHMCKKDKKLKTLIY